MYCDQLLRRVKAVLDHCRAWGVKLVVFPEYSIPWQLLGDVALASGELVVVAGTHSVDRAARASGLYERMGAPKPPLGASVCPVIYRGKLLALQPKLNPAAPEKGKMKEGEVWAPAELPEGLPGPLGVLVCLDFLYRESDRYRRLVAPHLEACRFLAVPALTPHYTQPEFAGKAWEEARHYKRPVLLANIAGDGGSSIFVDEGAPSDLRQFPDHAGFLEAGDEGVIVADVDLGFERVGASRRYDWEPPVVAYAEATFVYRANPVADAYAKWLEESAELLQRDGDDDAVDEMAARVEAGRDVILNAGALKGGAARGRRLTGLLRALDRMTSMEDLRRYTREVVLPADVLPLSALEAAMAQGASSALFEWMKDWRGGGVTEVEQRLRKAGEAAEKADPRAWTEAGKAALAVIARAARAPDESAKDEREAEVRRAPVPVVPAGLDPATFGVWSASGFEFEFRSRPEDFRSKHERANKPERNRIIFPTHHGGRSHRAWDRGASDVFLLAVAEGRDHVAVIEASRVVDAEKVFDGPVQVMGHFHDIGVLTVMGRDSGWEIWVHDEDDWWLRNGEQARAALEAKGLAPLEVRTQVGADLPARLEALRSRFDDVRERVRAFREERLRDVKGMFIPPFVRVGGKDGSNAGALDALNDWLASNEQTALILGEFGMGKSTTLAEWCSKLWEREEGPRPILVNLASASASEDAEAMLLEAAGLAPSAQNRAALKLLVRDRRLLPCFDGFDEMATRTGGGGLAARLSDLLRVAEGGGKVVITSRDHYFETESRLRSASVEALGQALGESAGLVRMTVQPFNEEQIRELTEDVIGDAAKAHDATARIASTYDLTDLVKRPLLLGMVLASLDRIDPRARVAPADVYEAYLQRWLSQTREDSGSFSHEQKVQFAEALAEELWRSGAASCSWEELRGSVRMRLFPKLPETMPPPAAFEDIQGGAFFVREGEDRYRFAHKSFLEYFLARSLVVSVVGRPREALATRPLTREVASFVGEVLRRRGPPIEAPSVQAVQGFLRAPGATSAAEARADEAGCEARANALRLLDGLARWAEDGAAWVPEGADLRGVSLVGEALAGVRLLRARLEGADLSGADLAGADLAGADLAGARLQGVRFGRAVLKGANLRGADLTMAEGDGCDVSGSDLAEAVLRQSVWTGCRWTKARLSRADGTAWVATGLPAEAGEALRSGSLEAAIAGGHAGFVFSISWSPDRTRIASGGWDGTVRLWDRASGKELARLAGHKGGVRAVAWEGPGRRLASGGEDGTVRLWDGASGQELARLEGHEGRVYAVAWEGMGRRLASGGEDGTVRLWDGASGEELARLVGHQRGAWAVAWEGTGRRLASGGNDRTVSLWDGASGEELARLAGHQLGVWAMAWEGAGRRLASGGNDGTVRLWDGASGQELARLAGHEGEVWAVAWEGTGRRLASGGEDGTVRLWDGASGQELARLAGHQRGVLALAWEGTGRRFASGGRDGTVKLWDGASGQELARLAGHEGWVLAVAWESTGRRLASAGSDGTVCLWDAATGKLLCKLLGVGSSSLARTPGGYCRFGQQNSGGLPRALGLRRVEPLSTGRCSAGSWKNWGRTTAWAGRITPSTRATYPS
ncbi:MAG TPA: pentapeptide repeat-containing protein [Polyangiaceae bacterium]|nr:pentapeptide repeat-containing protein [Polyangiaceae bacterium]